MKIPVCVRDGSVPGVIKIGDFEFEIDLTELSGILSSAWMDIHESNLPHRDLLMEALRCMEGIAFRVMTNGPQATDAENAKNLARMMDPDCTGGYRCGGHHDLDKGWLALEKIGGRVDHQVQARWDKQKWIEEQEKT
jgi:hypothetical protein